MVGSFLKTLSSLAPNETRESVSSPGVDLAHVGQQFGDREPVDCEFLKWVQAEDQNSSNAWRARCPGFFPRDCQGSR